MSLRSITHLGASCSAALAVALVVAVPHASAGVAKPVALSTARPVTETVRLAAPGSAVTVRARGTACGGAPVLAVSVDGGARATKRLGTGVQTLTVTRALAAGTHRVTVALANAHAQRGCRRSATVEALTVRVAPRTSAPAASAARTAPAVMLPVDDALPAAVASVLPPARAATTTTTTTTTVTTTTTTVRVPTVTVPPVTIPTVTVPPVTIPTVTVPPVTTPTVTVPPVTIPTVTVPPVTTPTVTVPPVTTPTVTVPPVTTPPVTTPPADTRAKLTWAPPALTAPTTINVAQGDQLYNLDTTKDYILNLGAVTHTGAVSITGGHNVVMIGGRIALSALSTKNTALVIKNSTGTVHVEGVDFDGTSGKEMDAIQIVAPAAIVQVENVRADNLLGTYDTNHSDVIQPYGGVSKLRVDRLTADSNYQGIFTRPDLGAIGSVDLRHVNMAFNNAAAGSTGGYLLWMTTGCDMAPTSLSDVYIQPRAGKTLAAAVWPTTSDASCPARVANGTATWPGLPVTGAVTQGTPAAGAYVPVGGAGPGYTSPGYL